MIRSLFFATALFALPSVASAGLIGQSVTIGYDFFGSLSDDSVTVGLGVEATCPGGGFGLCNSLTAPNQTIDITQDTITYRYDGSSGATSFTGGPGFNGFIFKQLDAGGAPVSTVTLLTSIKGLTPSQVSFTSSTISVKMNGLPLAANDYFLLGITFVAVPEPATGVVVLAALAGAFAVRRKLAAKN